MVSGMQVVVSGFVAKDPTFQTFPDGSAKAKLRVAYSARWQNRGTGEWMDGPTSFVGVECWRGLAENVAICVRKGDPVLVHGRLTVRSYQTPAGEWRQAVDVEADAIGHDLSRGVAQFNRIRRTAGDAAAARNRALAAMSAVASRRTEPPAGGVPEDGDVAENGAVAESGALAETRELLETGAVLGAGAVLEAGVVQDHQDGMQANNGASHNGRAHDGAADDGAAHNGTGRDSTGHNRPAREGTAHEGTGGDRRSRDLAARDRKGRDGKGRRDSVVDETAVAGLAAELAEPAAREPVAAVPS